MHFRTDHTKNTPKGMLVHHGMLILMLIYTSSCCTYKSVYVNGTLFGVVVNEQWTPNIILQVALYIDRMLGALRLHGAKFSLLRRSRNY